MRGGQAWPRTPSRSSGKPQLICGNTTGGRATNGRAKSSARLGDSYLIWRDRAGFEPRPPAWHPSKSSRSGTSAIQGAHRPARSPRAAQIRRGIGLTRGIILGAPRFSPYRATAHCSLRLPPRRHQQELAGGRVSLFLNRARARPRARKY